jgi:hypothetical protein
MAYLRSCSADAPFGTSPQRTSPPVPLSEAERGNSLLPLSLFRGEKGAEGMREVLAVRPWTIREEKDEQETR